MAGGNIVFDGKPEQLQQSQLDLIYGK
jgi:ABC-type phosphate/phosphonate transport system ATPase subunit